MKTENKMFTLGIVLLIFNKDQTRILLLKRNEEKRKKWDSTWGNIGGRVEFREYILDACLREAREETGLILNKKNLQFISIKESPNFLPTIHALHCIYFTKIDENTKITINHESDEYAWFDIDKLPDKTVDSKKDLIKFISLARK